MATEKSWEQVSKTVVGLDLEDYLPKFILDNLKERLAEALDQAWSQGYEAGLNRGTDNR